MGRPADREDGCGDAKVSLYCHSPKTEFEHAKSDCTSYSDLRRRLGADEPKRRMSLLQKAVKLDPMSLLANVNYAGMLSGFGRFEEAEQVIAHMKKIEPNSHMVFGAYSNLRRHQTRHSFQTYELKSS